MKTTLTALNSYSESLTIEIVNENDVQFIRITNNEDDSFVNIPNNILMCEILDELADMQWELDNK